MKAIRILLILGALLIVSALALPSAMAREEHSTTASAVHRAPTLLSPANNAFVPANPTLFWTAAPRAARYHLQVGSGTAFDEQFNFIEIWDLTTTSYFISSHPEAYFPQLYWRVQGIDANGNPGPWSTVWTFTITTPFP